MRQVMFEPLQLAAQADVAREPLLEDRVGAHVGAAQRDEQPQVLRRVRPHMDAGRSFVCVNTSQVAEEEVKYTVDTEGFVAELSKTVEDGLGEAVGINYVAAQDKAVLIAHLDACGEQDYFERGIETAIASDGLKVVPVDISDLFAVEVDFEGDLERANQRG